MSNIKKAETIIFKYATFISWKLNFQGINNNLFIKKKLFNPSIERSIISLLMDSLKKSGFFKLIILLERINF